MSTYIVDNELFERRKAHVKRTQALKSLRNARQKLVGGAGARPEFHFDLLHICARNELNAALAIPVLATVVTASLSYWDYSSTITLWLALVFLSEGALLILCRTFMSDPSAETAIVKWRNWISVAALSSGLSWGTITLFITPGGDTTVDVVIFATLIVVLCIRTIFASTIIGVVHASTLPVTIALVGYFLLANTQLSWVMAAMTLGVNAYFMFLTRTLNDSVLSLLELRAEKDALIAEIEESKAISDEARLRAESANLAKSRFLATMSHELRTPLNAILGFSEILKSELFGPHANPTYKEYAQDIHDSGEHLLKVINDILDLSRIEANRYELKEEAVQLHATAEDCIRLLKLRAEKKGLHICEKFAERLPKLWAEEKALRQVILNLLSNAIKFTPKDGTISIETGNTPTDELFLTIRDTGPGIPQDEIEKVLSPFGQGSLAHETAEGGTGLGLPIVKRLMEIHGGSFQLDSELRRGTTATVTFPAKRVMRALPPIDASNKKPARTTAPQSRTQTRTPLRQSKVNSAEEPRGRAKRTSKLRRSVEIQPQELLEQDDPRLDALTRTDKNTTANERDERRHQLEQLADRNNKAGGEQAAKALNVEQPSDTAGTPTDEVLPDEELSKLKSLIQSLQETERQGEQQKHYRRETDSPILSSENKRAG